MIGLAGFLGVSYLLITYGLPLVMPFAVALLIAEFINPSVEWLAKKARMPRSLAVALVLLLFVGIMSTLLTVGIGYLVAEIEKLIANLPYIYASVLDMGEQFADQFGAFHANLPASIQDWMASNLTTLQSRMESTLGSVAKLLGVLTGLPSLMVNTLIVFVATFFISRDRRQINDFLLTLFPVGWRPKLRQVKSQVWTSAMGWAKAQFMLIALTMAQSIAGLFLIGANYALLVGILVGLCDVMPVLGPGAVFVPWALYSLLFGSKVFGVKLLVLYGVVIGVRQVLESKLVGDQMGLHPLAVLLAMYLGFAFFGALGVVVGPLLAILLKAMVASGLLPIFPDDTRAR